jgi:O-acetylhomoserine/O-acetylserine sulfhydrylase-like pyridoxal-dependent enzyme
MKKGKTQSMHKSTKAIHAGSLNPPVYGEVSVPIFRRYFSFQPLRGASRFSGESSGYIIPVSTIPQTTPGRNIAILEKGLPEWPQPQAWLLLQLSILPC